MTTNEIVAAYLGGMSFRKFTQAGVWSAQVYAALKACGVKPRPKGAPIVRREHYGLRRAIEQYKNGMSSERAALNNSMAVSTLRLHLKRLGLSRPKGRPAGWKKELQA